MEIGLNREIISPIKLWRRSEHEDIPEILNLFQHPQTTQLFGVVKVSKLIEMAYLSLSVIDEEDNLVAFISMFDYPNIPGVPKGCWLSWLKSLYDVPVISERRVLFIHLLVWNIKYTYDFLKLLMDAVFINFVYIQHIILVVPPGIIVPDIFNNFFMPVLTKTEPATANVQQLYICMRQQHIPRLKIRLAVEEDHDVLMSIFDSISEELRRAYGEFCIAEIIAFPIAHRHIIVGEMDEEIIGMACLNTDINLDLLNEHFELGAFYGLHQQDQEDELIMNDPLEAESTEGLHLPFIIKSDDSLSKLSNVETLFEEFRTATSSAEFIIKEPQVSESEDFIFIKDESEEHMLFNHYFDDLNSDNDSEINMSRTSITAPSSDPSRAQPTSEEHVEKNEHIRKIPTYYGKQNAFSIDLFGMIESCDERLAFDFLEAAFECVPSMDYCILTIPAHYPVFPLLEHFVRVPPRSYRTLDHELYVLHRRAIMGELTVRVATLVDQASLEKLLTIIDVSEEILQSYRSTVINENSPFRAFVLEAVEEIVGIAIVSEEDDFGYLKSHYNIEDYILVSEHKKDQQGILNHLVMSPIFQRHANYFLREIHRQTEFSSLYYAYYCRESVPFENWYTNLSTVLGDLIPLKPRRQMEYNLVSLEENCPPDYVLRNEVPFALFHMNQRLSTLPKRDVNTRIVVVGASDTALSFLEVLLFGPTCTYLSFNNITLVSMHGIPLMGCPNKAIEKMNIFRGRYNERYMKELSLRTWVNMSCGILTSINRINKYVVISGETVLYYDYLMLFCGKQFQKPTPRKRMETSEAAYCHCWHGKKKPFDEIQELPQNVFIINTEIDAANAFTVLKLLIVCKAEYNIIVYGHCLEAFTCIATLQNFGIPGKNITFVEPFPGTNEVSIFNDQEVDAAVLESMKGDGITIHSSYFFSSWEIDTNNYKATTITFESRTELLSINCIAMFYYGTKGVSRKTFNAMHNTSIVYNGLLVIDNQFRTIDPYIFAAGALTKYSQRFYAENRKHKYFNSIEIGEAVAKSMIPIWYPCSNEKKIDEKYEKPTMLVQNFEKPIIISCWLPGQIRYLSVKQPGDMIPLDAAMEQDTYGQVLVTGNCQSDQGYFRVHLNTFYMIETITCYTKEDIDVNNIISLYGKHEQLLNNLFERFNQGLIQDFYDYFREPWTHALFHDHFGWLQRDNREVITSMSNKAASPLMEKLINALKDNKWQRLEEETFSKLENMYKNSPLEHHIMESTLEYLNNNGDHLPMYANEEVVRLLLLDFSHSSLHNNI